MSDANYEYGRVRWVEREVPVDMRPGGFSGVEVIKVLQQERWQVWGHDRGPGEWVDVPVEEE